MIKNINLNKEEKEKLKNKYKMQGFKNKIELFEYLKTALKEERIRFLNSKKINWINVIKNYITNKLIVLTVKPINYEGGGIQ